MAGKYKRYYIGAGATIIGLFVVLSMVGLIITGNDDTCAGTEKDPCISYLTVRNPTAKSVYIYNKEDIKLEFSPEIRHYELYVKYYRKWVYTNFTMDTRLGNIPKDRLYVFVFPRYSTKYFKLVGYKFKSSDTVKFGFGTKDDYLDPIWVGVSDLETKQECKTTFWNTTENIIGNCIRWVNKTICSDEPFNKSCEIVKTAINYDCVIDTKLIEHNETICWDTFYKYDDEVFNASEWCCYGELCGLIRDYDCNWIKEEKVASGHSYKNLSTGFVKIDDNQLKKHYHKEKEKLEVISFG